MGNAARFQFLADVAVDGAGLLYVADRGNHTIRKVVLSTGAVTTLAGTPGMPGSANGTGNAAQFAYPVGVALDGTGSLYVADTYNHAIRQVVLSTGVVTTFAGTIGVSGSTDGIGVAAKFNKPLGVAFDGVGNLYVTDTENHTIRKIALANAGVTTIAGIVGQGGVKLGPLPGRLGSPIGIAVLPTGEIFVASNSENAILKLH